VRAVIHANLDEAAIADGREQGRKLSADEAVALALASVNAGISSDSG
jgi:hypothetical protein